MIHVYDFKRMPTHIFPFSDSVIFDNSSAFLRNKKVFYNIIVANPARDLTISDVPEDEAGASTTM